MNLTRQGRALAREMVRYAESHIVDARELRPDECEPYRRTLGPYMVGVMIARVDNGRLARYVTVSREGTRPAFDEVREWIGAFLLPVPFKRIEDAHSLQLLQWEA